MRTVTTSWGSISRGTAGAGFTRVDLTDFGQTLDALLGVTARHAGLDAVVHLAAIPVNGLVPDAATFQNNVTVSFNVLFAAHRAGIRQVVLASSITAMGFPFDEAPPHLPVDESYTRANNTYGLGKVAEEAIAAQLAQWGDGMSVTALRYTNVVARGRVLDVRPRGRTRATGAISSDRGSMPATAPRPSRWRSPRPNRVTRSTTSRLRSPAMPRPRAKSLRAGFPEHPSPTISASSSRSCRPARSAIVSGSSPPTTGADRQRPREGDS